MTFASGLNPYTQEERDADQARWLERVAKGLARRKACSSFNRYDLTPDPKEIALAKRIVGEKVE